MTWLQVTKDEFYAKIEPHAERNTVTICEPWVTEFWYQGSADERPFAKLVHDYDLKTGTDAPTYWIRNNGQE